MKTLTVLLVLLLGASIASAQSSSTLDDFTDDGVCLVDFGDAAAALTRGGGGAPLSASLSFATNGHGQDMTRTVFVNSSLHSPATAATVDTDAGLLTLLSSASLLPSSGGLPSVRLMYTYDAGGGIDLTSFSGLRVRYASTTQHKVHVALFHDLGSPGSRYSGGGDVFADQPSLDIDFSSMQPAGQPASQPAGTSTNPVTRIVFNFTLTHPEESAPVIESIEFY